MIDTILQFLYDLAAIALALLPDSPFAALGLQSAFDTYREWMSWINYFVPVGTMLGILTAYLGCVLIWYGVRWILRLAQYID